MRDNGFLGYGAPWIIDFVNVALVAVIPILIYSIILAKKGHYRLHKKIQITLNAVLFLTVLAFEIELRRLGGIYSLIDEANDTPLFTRILIIHLCFAIPTPFIWGYTLFSGLKKFKNGFKKEFFASHRFWARISVFFLVSTSITGALVYIYGFVKGTPS